MLTPYFEQINSRAWLTNRGPLVQQLEAQLAERIGGGCQVSLVANGTIALMCALRAAGARGEVITTPYTYIATASAIVWSGCRPVFADVTPDGFNICPESVERLITPSTSAIVAVHCYGNPCGHAALSDLARRHNLKLIYDAAHVSDLDNEHSSPLNLGEYSVVSLHATKVLHAAEGGFVVCQDEASKRRVDRIAGFGLESELSAIEIGLNGKMSEINAAIGLVNLRGLKLELDTRRQIYSALCDGLDGLSELALPPLGEGNAQPPCSYFPVRINGGEQRRDRLFRYLSDNDIGARRYFFPLVSEFIPFRKFADGAADRISPNAYRASREVLCLPLHGRMSMSDVDRIVTSVRYFFQN